MTASEHAAVNVPSAMEHFTGCVVAYFHHGAPPFHGTFPWWSPVSSLKRQSLLKFSVMTSDPLYPCARTLSATIGSTSCPSVGSGAQYLPSLMHKPPHFSESFAAMGQDQVT